MKFLLMSLLFLSSGLSAAFFEGENDTLLIVGSTSVSQLIKQTKRPFYDKTGINILVRPIGSQKGVTSIGESVSDIGIISRF